MRARLFLLWILLPFLTSFFWGKSETHSDPCCDERCDERCEENTDDILIVKARACLDAGLHTQAAEVYLEVSAALKGNDHSLEEGIPFWRARSISV